MEDEPESAEVASDDDDDDTTVTGPTPVFTDKLSLLADKSDPAPEHPPGTLLVHVSRIILLPPSC